MAALVGLSFFVVGGIWLVVVSEGKKTSVRKSKTGKSSQQRTLSLADEQCSH